MSANCYLGVLDDVIEGRWLRPDTGKPVSVPLKKIVIEDSLEGSEADLVAAVHGDEKLCVVCDSATWEILGARVSKALGARAGKPLVLERPKANDETVGIVREASAYADALIAVGSGTVTDLTKHAAYLSRRPFSVFATTPMNAYSTATASITVSGVKQSLTSQAAHGAFFDLNICSSCPRRLLLNGLGDVVCRSSAQIDWMLSRDFKGTTYSEAPYILLAQDERELFAGSKLLLQQDNRIVAVLIRTCIINGLGSMLVGSSHPGSMAEHSISHYLDMPRSDPHPGSMHGEQVGVATLTVMRLQEQILNAAEPPVLQPTASCGSYLADRYGEATGAEFARASAANSLSAREADSWNDRWQGKGWGAYVEPYRRAMLASAVVEQALVQAGAPTRASELGFGPDLYREAVRDARHLRARFSILDIAGDSGLLEDYVAAMPV